MMIHIRAGQFYIVPLSLSVLTRYGICRLIQSKIAASVQKNDSTHILLIVYSLIKRVRTTLRFISQAQTPCLLLSQFHRDDRRPGCRLELFPPRV